MALIIDNLTSEGLVEHKNLRSQVNAVTVAASTQTLTVASEYIQSYTGSVTGQVVKMPDATTLTVGYQYLLLNDSSTNITIQNNASGALLTLASAQRVLLVCTGTGSAAGTWSYSVFASTPAGGTQFYTTYPGTGLAVNYLGGNYRINGTLTAVAAGTITLPATTTGTIYVDIDGVVKATASIPAGATPLYNFTTSGSAVTSLTDVREEIENNLIWGVAADIVTQVAGQAKSAGTLEKYARADHTHGNGNILVKAGTVAAGSFSGSPKKAAVAFSTAFASTSYAIAITGTDSRVFTWENKGVSGFTINANANAALTGNVDWTATMTGEAT